MVGGGKGVCAHLSVLAKSMVRLVYSSNEGGGGEVPILSYVIYKQPLMLLQLFFGDQLVGIKQKKLLMFRACISCTTNSALPRTIITDIEIDIKC